MSYGTSFSDQFRRAAELVDKILRGTKPGIGRFLAVDNPIDALAIRLLGLEPQPELLAHHRGQKAAHRVRLPAGAQSCCWFCGRRMALDRRKSRQRAPSQRGRSMTAPSTRPELRISAPQLKRE